MATATSEPSYARRAHDLSLRIERLTVSHREPERFLADREALAIEARRLSRMFENHGL